MTQHSPITSTKPVQLPGGPAVRVTAPAAPGERPLVVFSHGFGWSMNGYAPLCEHWAAAGFAVVQPTHLDSRALGVPQDDPRTPHIWRSRIADLVHVLDHLDLVERVVPGAIDRDRVAVAGHSWGAQSAGTLLGARVLGEDTDFTDSRVRAGVLLAVTGTGEGLTPFAAEHFPFMRPDFAAMATDSLIVAGDDDHSPLSTRGPDWFTDAYRLSPPAKSLVVLTGAQHSLGGIVGHGVRETTDENPERVAVVQRLTTAYLTTALGIDAGAWDLAEKIVGEHGVVESK